MSQFVYARGAHVPDVLIKGTTVYQMVTDHLGSVRLVVQMSNGAIAQRIDYDDWGTPTYVTGNADLQPFAFAGGLWDPDTKLLHLGAREYDPEVRRFLTRDPSGFAGGWNLYGYAGNDPVNYVDPDGNTPWLAAAAVGAGVGAVSDIALQLALNGGNFDCLDWGDVGVAAGLGALGGAGLGKLLKGKKLGQGVKDNWFRFDKTGSWKHRGQWQHGPHFHVDPLPGSRELMKHHLPNRSYSRWKNLQSILKRKWGKK